MNEDLKPCPFCGSQNVSEYAQRLGRSHCICIAYGCDKCGAEGPLKYDDTAARAAWNIRENISTYLEAAQKEDE